MIDIFFYMKFLNVEEKLKFIELLKKFFFLKNKNEE